MRTRALMWLGAVALLGGVVIPAARAENHELTVPTSAGETVSVTWEGTVLPGAQPASECGATDFGADEHEITITVPPGTYDSVVVNAVASVDYEGQNDLVVTVVKPDGTTVSGDQGFVNSPESASYANPEPGVHTVIACMFAGATPQPYTGTLQLTAAALPEPTTPCVAPAEELTFSAPTYVDMERAGGEPSVRVHPNGQTLLYAAHAGTTHFYTPEAGDDTTGAFFEHYRGQVYAWYSDDLGQTWTYVDRQPPLSGFSDPDFAIDAAGNVFLSEINLVNVAVSRSPVENAGREYTLQNFFGFTLTDRQWKEAGPEDMLFMVGNASGGGTAPGDPVGHSGHIIIRSTDGGETFSEVVQDEGGLGDLAFDHGTGTLYEAHLDGGALQMAAFRNATNTEIAVAEALTPEIHAIADGVDMLSHWPAIDVDTQGNLYITWDEGGNGARDAGVWYSYSTDGGRTWAAPIRVDEDDRTDIWPWIAVGDPGRVAVAWFGNDASLPDHDAEQAGEGDGWNVMVAQTDSGLGCAESSASGFNVAQAADDFHVGTVCMGGTVCQAQLIDRRLGDYFVIDIDATGAVVAAYSDTREGGAVALPAFVRQSGGPSFVVEG